MSAIFVEGNVIATGDDLTEIGSAELEPGLYKVEFRVGCGFPEQNGFGILIKRPSDDQGLPISGSSSFCVDLMYTGIKPTQNDKKHIKTVS